MSEKKKSVYSSIADDILGKIIDGTYKIGTLLPPEREFMGIYSVQRTTIRRGLDILSDKGYIKKVAGLGSVVQSKTPVATDGAPAEKAVSNNVETALLLTSEDAKNMDSLPPFMVELISCLCKNGGFITSDISQAQKHYPFIALNHIPETDLPVCIGLYQSDDHRCVILDNDKGAYVALTYLEGLGHSKIAYIGTENGLSFENAAYDSFSTVNSYFDNELVNLAGSDEKSGFDGFSELFRRHGGKFTAVCAQNSNVARGIIKAAKYYKVKVPEDLSVISLCSNEKEKDIDCIIYNTGDLADEIIASLGCATRVSTVLFGGNLTVNGSCASINAQKSDEKHMSNFLL